MKNGSDNSAVLLCAEDDDLELVELVHLGRQQHLEFEVVPGVEVDDDPMAQAVARNAEALFVLLRSEHLSRERALQLKHRFESLRKAGQHLLAIRLDPERTVDALSTIARRLEQLGGCEPSRLPLYESLATSGYPTINEPIANDSQMPPPPEFPVGGRIDLGSTGPRPIVTAQTEYAITERTPILSDETTPVHALEDVRIVKPAPRRKPGWLLVAAAGGAIALSSAVAGGIMLASATDDAAAKNVPSVVIETEVEEADPNEGVRVAAEPPPPPAAVVHPLDPKVTDEPPPPTKKKRR